jgi:hypothetical protein
MRALCLLVCLSLTLPAAAADEKKPPQERLKVLILDMKGNLPEEQRTSISNLLATEMETFPVEVLSSADMRAMVELEGERQALGCEADTSCLAEIAGALGAALVLFGDVTKLGSRSLLNLNLFDSTEGRAVGRSTIKGANLDEVIDGIPAGLRKVVGPALEQNGIALAPVEPPPPPPGEGPSLLGVTLLGVGGVGVIGGVATTFIALGHEDAAASTNVQLARKEKYDEANGMWIATAVLGSVGVASLVGGLAFMGGE